MTKLHADVDALFSQLDTLSETARKSLDDGLAREQFKEKVLLSVGSHKELHSQIQGWAEQKAQYLATRETIVSSSEAHQHLSLLESYEKAKARNPIFLLFSVVFYDNYNFYYYYYYFVEPFFPFFGFS